MLMRCKQSFETREGGVPQTIEEGTVWYKAKHDHVPGGYEVVIIEKVDGGAFTGIVAKVRLERIMDTNIFEDVPLSECVTPIGCSVYHH